MGLKNITTFDKDDSDYVKGKGKNVTYLLHGSYTDRSELWLKGSSVSCYEVKIQDAFKMQDKIAEDEELDSLYLEALIAECNPKYRLNHTAAYQRQINRALVYATPMQRCKALLAVLKAKA